MASMEGVPKRPRRIPSCEPCRLAKLACDHIRPVCSRCSRKGTPNDCVYRKDPFKRNRLPATPEASRASDRRDWAVNLSPDSGSQPHNLELTLYPNPGFQGYSSLTNILENIDHESSHGSTFNSSSCDDGPSDEDGWQGSEPIRSAIIISSSAALIQEGAIVLELFTSYLTDGTLQKFFDDWKFKGMDAHLGSFLVRPFFDTVMDATSDILQAADRHSGLLALSGRLFENGRTPVKVHEASSLREFEKHHIGQNLRWETVGLILTLAGNAATELRAPHAVCKTEQERHTLRRNLVHSSNRCVSFCESLDTLTDVQIIFMYESFLLYSVYYGDQSFRTWQRLNAATSALVARGLHQSFDRDGKLPFFLTELRKHVFSRIYGSDISFAVFLGRPPHISRRFCTIHAPLDVCEETYHLSGDALRDELQHLDQHGWNTLGQIRTHAVLRWSVTTCKIREETMEVIFGSDVSESGEIIRNLRIKIEEAWNQLPCFLAVPAQEVWQRGRSSKDTDSLYLIRLFYLQTILLIEWTASLRGTEDPDALFIVASDVLSWVNEALIRRERLGMLGLNRLAWRVAACGLPAAGVLARCILPGVPQPSQQWQNPISLEKVIQDLSVLLAHLEYLYDSSDSNFKLFSRAKVVLSRVIRAISRPSDSNRAGAPPTAVQGLSASLDESSFENWEFRPELWIGLPSQHSVEFDALDSI